MKYFLSKVVKTEFSTLSFVSPKEVTTGEPSIVHFAYDRIGDQELHGIDGDITSEQVLALQHGECQVEEVTFDSVADRLKECRFAKEINEQTVSDIRSKYSVDTELKIMKMDPASADYEVMIAWIESCRSEGTAKKIALGIKQA